MEWPGANPADYPEIKEMTLFSKYHRRPKIPILMYHEVSKITERNKKIRSTNPIYSLSIRQFREQMEYLCKNGYQTLSLNEFMDLKVHNNEKSVVITFDDGWVNNYTYVFPVLEKLGLTATFFVITDFVGESKYVDWNQLKEMNKEGMSIQSHTVSHRPLIDLETPEMMYELDGSKQKIEEHLGTAVDFLSAPHGIISQKVVDVARIVGYKAICTSEPGFSHLYSDPAILNRTNIPDKWEISKFERIVQANQMSLLSVIFSKKIKNLTKKLLGYNNYRKIYRLRHRIGE